MKPNWMWWWRWCRAVPHTVVDHAHHASGRCHVPPVVWWLTWLAHLCRLCCSLEATWQLPTAKTKLKASNAAHNVTSWLHETFGTCYIPRQHGKTLIGRQQPRKTVFLAQNAVGEGRRRRCRVAEIYGKNVPRSSSKMPVVACMSVPRQHT